ncbi:A disintegrin and metalloproteinase with thrombospondin motifs 6 [Holothuria leucospilota]|uniref:A disintegrin and metalloproteinase with thrombospondin motifs 6 n=1 Tax=Holothuria leucospilota TaxID=206669 RepID=A0A9Q1BAP5_HOLLE|nr:A disintegrin and metalloproteinase with thrombospondin motifs 6 [Holothuria leucospilota]
MYGFINQGEKDLFIAPLQSHHANEYSKRRKRQSDKPHLVYKLKNGTSSFCDIDDINIIMRNDNPQSSLEQAIGSGYLPKYMEIFLMLDFDFYQKNSPNEAAYAIAIMHVVSRRFAEPSLDVSLKLFIVRLVVLMTDSPTLDGQSFFVQPEGATLVGDLCTWSSIVNPPNGFSGHWDNLVLLSGKDLFSFFSGFGLLGRVRSLDGTCEVGQECSINEDIGLSAGLVVAHEIGHTLTLSHDNLVGCGSNGYVMNSFAGANSNSFRWSSCSRDGLQLYLQNPASFCMDDVPIGYEALPVVNLPGQVYSLDEQCNLAFPSGASGCFIGSDSVDCLFLRCNQGFGCTSTFRTTAEGTPCNANGTMICLDGDCVEATSVPVPVDGGWSEWVEYECSRTCDCGIRLRERECNNPEPFWGGAPCDGPSVEYNFCNTNVSCGNTDDDFRDEQCAASNQYPYLGENYFWFSNFGSFIPDFLYCQNPCFTPQLPNTGTIPRPPLINTDGTGCWDYGMEDWNKVFKCIRGTCEQFGCDGVLHGSKVFDDCLICNGDGSSCDCISSTIDVNGMVGKFNDLVAIPAGSTVVFIQNENLMDGNHVAIAGEDGGYYFQGTGALPALDLRASRGTTTIIHDYNSMNESFFAVGPIHEELTIQIYLSVVNTSISYQYCTPKDDKTFYWDVCEWSECSATCNGTQTRNVDCACVEDGIKSYATDEDCLNGIGPKPAVARQCNGAICPEWVTGPLSECDVTCGTGNQIREVECLFNGTVVPDFYCNFNDRPPAIVQCQLRECIPGCGIIIDAIQGSPVGTIISPFFPDDYPSDVRCSTYIFAEPGYQIKLFFGQFSLQSSPEDNCPTDRLEITNLVTCTTEVICGTNSNFTKVLDNAVLMDLVTNDVNNTGGFKLSYTLM